MTGSGITVQALRRHRWAFLGPVAVQTTAAAILSAMIMLAWSINRAPLTKPQRHALISPEIGDMTGVFIGVSVELSILMVGVAMNLVIAGQARDIALLRAIGATPGRIRRSAAAQAAITAVPSSVVGYLLGTVLGAVWASALRDHGLLPTQVAFHPSVPALPLVGGIVIATSVLGALVAAIRPSRIRPAVALTDSATGRPRIGVLRTVLGMALVIGGVVLTFVAGRLDADKANNSAFFVLLALCVGVGMLGPVILKAVVAITRPVAKALGGSGMVAADGVAAMSRPLSGALVPLVLAIAFAIVKVAMHTTSAHVTGTADAPADIWLDYAGTGVYCVFAAIAAWNTLITVMARRRRDLAVTRLAGADRRRLLGIVGIEAVIVLGTALVLAAVVGGLTLAPMLHTQLHTWLPYLPTPYLVAGMSMAAVVVAVGMLASAAMLTRRRAIDVVAAAS
jgi:putative ABC transport system permease protein